MQRLFRRMVRDPEIASRDASKPTFRPDKALDQWPALAESEGAAAASDGAR